MSWPMSKSLQRLCPSRFARKTTKSWLRHWPLRVAPCKMEFCLTAMRQVTPGRRLWLKPWWMQWWMRLQSRSPARKELTKLNQRLFWSRGPGWCNGGSLRQKFNTDIFHQCFSCSALPILCDNLDKVEWPRVLPTDYLALKSFWMLRSWSMKLIVAWLLPSSGQLEDYLTTKRVCWSNVALWRNGHH